MPRWQRSASGETRSADRTPNGEAAQSARLAVSDCCLQLAPADVRRRGLEEQVLDDHRKAERDQQRGQETTAQGLIQQAPLQQIAE